MNEEYDKRVLRLKESEKVFVHTSTLNNIVNICKHGLIPLDDLVEKGMYPEKGGFHPGYSKCPDANSFYYIDNFVKYGIHFLMESPLVLIDESNVKYSKKFGLDRPHPIIEKSIAREDILGVVVEEKEMTPQPDSLYLYAMNKLGDLVNIHLWREKYVSPCYREPQRRICDFLSEKTSAIPVYIFNSDEKNSEMKCEIQLYNN